MNTLDTTTEVARILLYVETASCHRTVLNIKYLKICKFRTTVRSANKFISTCNYAHKRLKGVEV